VFTKVPLKLLLVVVLNELNAENLLGPPVEINLAIEAVYIPCIL